MREAQNQNRRDWDGILSLFLIAKIIMETQSAFSFRVELNANV